jgi:hypothetical protein
MFTCFLCMLGYVSALLAFDLFKEICHVAYDNVSSIEPITSKKGDVLCTEVR